MGSSRLETIKSDLEISRINGRDFKVTTHEMEIDDVQFLLSVIDELAILVRGVQWAGSNAVCPWCGSIAGDNNARHYSDCPRQAELAELEK